MLNNITIGQYFPTGSIIHRLDPRVKLVLTIAFIVFVFLADNAFSLGLCLVFLVSCMFATKVPIKMYFKMMKTILPVILFTSVLNAFYVKGADIAFHYWIFTVYWQGIERAIFMTLRISMLILVSSLLTYTTSPTELTDAIERLLSPLKLLHLESQVHTLAMMMSIALRFIPTLIEETDKIMSAQKARGADLETGSIMQRIRAMLPILIPLLISSSRRAYDLAEAMECRCYNGGHGRTKMKQLHFAPSDFTALLITGAVCTAVILLRFV